MVNNREANARWWAIVEWGDEVEAVVDLGKKKQFFRERRVLGYTGIQHIDWINSHGEISLLIGPEYQGKGYGTEAFDAVLRKAFHSLNLHMVWGEAYPVSRAFWEKALISYESYMTIMPHRVYRNGAYRESLYFSITAGAYEGDMLHTSESR